jgi:hypothetical protein
MYVSRTSRLALRLVAASALHVLLSGPAKTIEKQWVFFLVEIEVVIIGLLWVMISSVLWL